ncbi:MAG: IS200/IS605 family transposase [Pirellulales bacterium]|nr:IS200/IS605 family transposase [Pirellulales bacterium]
MGSTLTNLVYHVIFSTRSREQFIVPEIRNELHHYMGGIIKGEGGVLIQAGGTSDHIHIVIRLKPVHALSEMMQKIKGNSSKWINEHQRLNNKFAWQVGYGAFTVSESQIQAVIRYVREQEAHHRKQTFKKEFDWILKRHRVEYDERYIWT